jgi:hypothetical protein
MRIRVPCTRSLWICVCVPRTLTLAVRRRRSRQGRWRHLRRTTLRTSHHIRRQSRCVQLPFAPFGEARQMGKLLDRAAAGIR